MVAATILLTLWLVAVDDFQQTLWRSLDHHPQIEVYYRYDDKFCCCYTIQLNSVLQ